MYKTQRRTLNINKYYEYIRERRREQKAEGFRQKMRVRAQVERTISEDKRFLGFRYAKYKGEVGHQLQFYLTGAALNVKRLIKALNNGRELVQMSKA